MDFKNGVKHFCGTFLWLSQNIYEHYVGFWLLESRQDFFGVPRKNYVITSILQMGHHIKEVMIFYDR